MILTKNEKANFEELKAEIFILISNAKNDRHLLKELKDIIKSYEESEMTLL